MVLKIQYAQNSMWNKPNKSHIGFFRLNRTNYRIRELFYADVNTV